MDRRQSQDAQQNVSPDKKQEIVAQHQNGITKADSPGVEDIPASGTGDEASEECRS